ncbi:hypothetical protein [Streptomyces bohaiensis]|uniref:Uncharacterized protein n=1 Tax=Streptomyces bohaiensis TaxID=1431344 RepID=A0ABX1C4R5_9ACTN|nr:hypothetical protein [Streptomyces bohaiensis]NJQ14211.1 hypothetical protein [Streptomyces bohaiensis]
MITFGAFATIFVIFTVYLFLWWRAGHKVKAAFFGIAMPLILGTLIAACTGGLIGHLAGWSAKGANGVGGLAAGGTGALDGQVAGAAGGVSLTQGGAIVTLALLAVGLVALIGAIKGSKKGAAIQLGLLAACGAVLALTAGGGGLASSTVYTAVNWMGDPITGWVNGA